MSIGPHVLLSRIELIASRIVAAIEYPGVIVRSRLE